MQNTPSRGATRLIDVAVVKLSNEFQFQIAAFHHASEAYLVPGVLKNAYGAPVHSEPPRRS